MALSPALQHCPAASGWCPVPTGAGKADHNHWLVKKVDQERRGTCPWHKFPKRNRCNVSLCRRWSTFHLTSTNQSSNHNYTVLTLILVPWQGPKGPNSDLGPQPTFDAIFHLFWLLARDAANGDEPPWKSHTGAFNSSSDGCRFSSR